MPTPMAAKAITMFRNVLRLVTVFRETVALVRISEIRVIVVGTAILILWQYYGYPHTYIEHFAAKIGSWRYEPIAGSLYWTATNVLLLLALPLISEKFQRENTLGGLGLGLGDWKLGSVAAAACYAVMVPFILLAAQAGDFQATYPLDRNALASAEMFWVYEVSYVVFFIGWEFFFRGYLLFSLEPKLGAVAIAVQTVPFALMHLGKPFPEALGSIFAGLFLGMLALRTRSIWYGAALHAAVAVTMDILVFAGYPAVK
jgi:membrane protease YdiL (CAAX protease family)